MSRSNFSNTTVLYIEPDEFSRNIVSNNLLRTFKKVFFCMSGEEGFEIFEKNKIDLVISEYDLPGIDGIELLKKLRKQSWLVPFIFVTHNDDKKFIIDSINLDVNQLVRKPINMRNLNDALHAVVNRLVAENTRKERLEDEIKSLRNYEKYHFYQQEETLLKELHAINNDMKMKSVNTDKSLWLLDTLYRGMDIMSGDSYSIHRVSDTKIFGFIVDAMGKGLGASVTSMQSTTFINYLARKNYTSLHDIVSEFLIYIKQSLLTAEILCVVFFDMDFQNMVIEYVSFGMPEGYIQFSDKSVTLLKANNLPISVYLQDFKIDRLEVPSAEKIMFYSDGFADATDNIATYSEFIQSEFALSDTLISLKRKFSRHDFNFYDDTTVVFIKLANGEVLLADEITVSSSLENISKLEEFLDNFLNNVSCGFDNAMIKIAFSEAVMNAYEHGNLGLDMWQKHYALEAGNYEDLIVRLQQINSDKKIHVALKHVKDFEDLIVIYIKDDGEGFRGFEPSARRDPMFLCGRGIDIIRQYSDGLYYIGNGNEVMLIFTT